jgi:hypothetical protein
MVTKFDGKIQSFGVDALELVIPGLRPARRRYFFIAVLGSFFS